MARRVYVHIGLPKTGTSYLQRSLWLSRPALAASGVLLPGESHQVQRFAFWDLLGRRLRGVNQPKVPGSWNSLVQAIGCWTGDRVILTDEFLVNARPAHVRRMVRALAPAEMHVVVTVRDLGRLICSMWEQEVAKSRTWSWSEFLAAVRDPNRGPATAGIAFWLRCDLQKILATWEQAVPPERIHIVVVPPPGSPPTRLLERFAATLDLDVDALTPPPAEVNNSVGVTETEILRRLNTGLGGRLNERQYLHIMRRIVKPVLRSRTGTSRTGTSRIEFSAADREWIDDRTTELVDFLKSRPYQVVGDLDDLVAVDGSAVGVDPQHVSEAALTEAAVAVLTATVEQYADLWWKTQRRRGLTNEAEWRTRLTSAGRALGYKARFGVLEEADRSRLVARAAQLYLRHTSRGQ
jgi:hypothetical protein